MILKFSSLFTCFKQISQTYGSISESESDVKSKVEEEANIYFSGEVCLYHLKLMILRISEALSNS